MFNGKLIFLFSLIFVSHIQEINKYTVKSFDANRFFVDLSVHNAGNLTEQLDDYFADIVSFRKFNGSFLVAKDGKIIYKNSNGYADYKQKEKNEITSSYQLASVSKQFTALSIIMLKEKGLLHFDDSVSQFIPEFPYKDITIRHLLTHRSGLPNYMYFCDVHTDKETPLSNDDVLALLCKFAPPVYFKPDEKFAYSNTGYFILASIVEKITQDSFETFLVKHIFEPLGMKNSFVFNFNKESVSLKKGVALGYEANWRIAEPIYLDGVVGDKGIYSTVEDLFKWDQALYTEKLASQKAIREAFEPGSTLSWGDRNYGFGWRLRYLPNGKKLVYHGGWWRGFNSLIVRDIETKTSFIVLSNCVTSNMPVIFEDMINILELNKQDENLILAEKLPSPAEAKYIFDDAR